MWQQTVTIGQVKCQNHTSTAGRKLGNSLDVISVMWSQRELGNYKLITESLLLHKAREGKREEGTDIKDMSNFMEVHKSLWFKSNKLI